MWASLKRLNDPPKIKTALEIVREDNIVSKDIKEVLSRWFKDISTLFSGMKNDPDIVFDDEFYNKIVEKNKSRCIGYRLSALEPKQSTESTVFIYTYHALKVFQFRSIPLSSLFRKVMI